MLWMGWVAVAAAEDVVWDFDTTFPSAVFSDGSSFGVDTPPVPWDGDAFRIDLGGGYYNWNNLVLEDLVVTHDTLLAMAWTDALWEQWVVVVLSAVDGDGGALVSGVPIQPGGPWTPVTHFPGELAEVCGQTVYFDVLVNGWGSTTQPGRAFLDDVGTTGAVCAVFVDGDGDGLCPQGVDLDGDGTCVAPPERWAYDETADCDDARFGPGCLGLAAGAVLPGSPVRLTASGATPGATVWFARSDTLGDTCPAALGGACLGLASPRPFGSAVADPDGVAVLELPVPAGAPSGAARSVQAVELAASGPANVSPVVTVTVP